MRALRGWFLRLWGFSKKNACETRFTQELEAHLQMHIEDNLRSGMTPEQARREATAKLGGVEWAKQAYREQNTLPFFENRISDLRFAIRQLYKNPGFAVTAILLLALGTGATVAIFAFVDAALIKPLPYQNPNGIVNVFEKTATCPRCNVSYLNFRDWKMSQLPFSSLQAWSFSTYLLPAPTGTEPASGARVTDGFFRMLGVVPMLGRDFYLGEDAPGSPNTVLISYAAWKRRFGGANDVVGRTVRLSDETYVIIGVLPQEFHFAPRDAEFWATLNDLSSCEMRRSCHSLNGLARLKDGVSIQSASTAMESIAQRLEKQYPDDRGYTTDVVALSEVISGSVRSILFVLLIGAGLLLLIACVNVSSLLLVRSEGRKREVAIRGALGASVGRLVVQFATEGLVLVVAGGALGLGSAYLAMQLLVRLVPVDMMANMPYLEGLGFNLRVLAFAGLIALVAGSLFSIVPAMRVSLADMRGSMSEGGRTSAGTLWRSLGSKLVVVELTTAVVLLVSAGLLSKSLYRLLHVDVGMQQEHLATLQVTLPSFYQESKQIMALERQIVDQVGRLPGVESVGITTSLPSSGWGMATNILVAGRPWNGEHNSVPERDVSPDYLKTLDARLLHGRYFTYAEDDPSKPHVAVINQALAKAYFPGEDPIGKQLLYEVTREPIEVVGVVQDVKEGPLDTGNQPVLYDPFSPLWFRSFSIVVRTSQDEQVLLPQLAQAIQKINAGIATSHPMAMNDLINDSQAAYERRSSAWLIGSFAFLALLLSVVGLYGVIAYSVSQRSREIGVRMALGAQRSSVYQLILREAGWLVATGTVAGLVCAVATATLMRKLLFDVQVWDVSTLASVAVVLTVFAMLASFIPARRAASINPVEVLRSE